MTAPPAIAPAGRPGLDHLPPTAGPLADRNPYGPALVRIIAGAPAR